MKRFLAGLLGAVALTFGGVANADTYPSRPVTIVVAWPPGSGIDVMVRHMNEALRAELGQPIIIDNRGGAAGVVGAQLVANAAPDGYTVLFTSSALNMVAAMGTKTTYNAKDSFVPIVNVAWSPSLLLAHPSLGVKTPQELVTLAKSRPGKLFYATAGHGAPSHFVTEMFRVRTGIDAVAIAFRGSPEAMLDQVAGRVHFSVANSSTALPQVRQGTVTALAVTSRQRLAAAPEIPTMIEQGFADFAAASYWNGLLGPKGLPQPVAEKLATAVNRVLTKQDVLDRMAPSGNEIDGKSTPESFATLIREDAAIWSEVARAANIRAQ
jgi:tripartite-type tricarboxylate transporter receptor subunit TctC